jgi:hypothetical protein
MPYKGVKLQKRSFCRLRLYPIFRDIAAQMHLFPFC